MDKQRHSSEGTPEHHGSNRRAFHRWPAEFEIRYGVGKELLAGTPIEIGEGGLAFHGEKSYPLETELNVEYRFIPGVNSIATEVEPWVGVKVIVRYVKDNRTGVEFLNLRIHDRLKIVDYVMAQR